MKTLIVTIDDERHGRTKWLGDDADFQLGVEMAVEDLVRKWTSGTLPAVKVTAQELPKLPLLPMPEPVPITAGHFGEPSLMMRPEGYSEPERPDLLPPYPSIHGVCSACGHKTRGLNNVLRACTVCGGKMLAGTPCKP